MIIKAELVKSLPLDQREHNGKVYKKRPIEVKTRGKYPNVFKIIFEEQKMNLLRGMEKGKEYEFHINLRGRKWEKNGKEMHFTDLICWKVDPAQSQKEEVTIEELEDGDDLPF